MRPSHNREGRKFWNVFKLTIGLELVNGKAMPWRSLEITKNKCVLTKLDKPKSGLEWQLLPPS